MGKFNEGDKVWITDIIPRIAGVVLENRMWVYGRPEGGVKRVPACLVSFEEHDGEDAIEIAEEFLEIRAEGEGVPDFLLTEFKLAVLLEMKKLLESYGPSGENEQ